MTWLLYKDACHDKLANVEESTRPLAKGKNQGNFGTNLRSVLPKTLYEQDCKLQIHVFLFFPLVSTDESIYPPSLVLFICISWPGLCIFKAPVAPKTIFTPFDKHLFIKRRHRHDLYFFSVLFSKLARIRQVTCSESSSI